MSRASAEAAGASPATEVQGRARAGDLIALAARRRISALAFASLDRLRATVDADQWQRLRVNFAMISNGVITPGIIAPSAYAMVLWYQALHEL